MIKQTSNFTIVSGGQTGADRAALDWAIRNGVDHSGWCPLGRSAEDGVLDPVYRLTETDSPGYRRPTIWNVRDSDATLIVNTGELEGGTLETERTARRLGKPCLVAQVDSEPADDADGRVRAWLNTTPIQRLNIAGPRASKRPEIYGRTFALLERYWERQNRKLGSRQRSK
jgi:hypothetical protein